MSLTPLEATLFTMVKYGVYGRAATAVSRQATKVLYPALPKENRGSATLPVVAVEERNTSLYGSFDEPSGPMCGKGAPSPRVRHGGNPTHYFNKHAAIPTPERLTDKYRHALAPAPGGDTFNNLAANRSVTRPIFDSKTPVDRMISGECLLPQMTFSSANIPRQPSMMKKHKQVTSMDLIRRVVMRTSDASEYAQRLYKFSDEEVIEMFHSRKSLHQHRLEHHPESAQMQWNPLHQFRLVSANRTPANFKVIITRSRRSQQHEWGDTDSGWGLHIVSDNDERESLKVENPLSKHNRDSLVSFSHPLTGENITMNMTSRQYFKSTAMVVQSLQTAIQAAEGAGYDWEVRHDRSYYWPANRHKLYTDNFPFRGNHKKPFSDLSAKRQKGGDWILAKRREFCPTLRNHFDAKSDDELFA